MCFGRMRSSHEIWIHKNHQHTLTSSLIYSSGGYYLTCSTLKYLQLLLIVWMLPHQWYHWSKLLNSVRIKELTSSLSWPVHRRMLQWQAHRTVWSLTVLPVRNDLTRRGTVRIWEEREGGGWREGGGGIPVHCCINNKHAILGHMEKKWNEIMTWNRNEMKTGNGNKERTNHYSHVHSLPALHSVMWFRTPFIVRQWGRLHGRYSPLAAPSLSLRWHLCACSNKTSCSWISLRFSGSDVWPVGPPGFGGDCCWDGSLQELGCCCC